MDIIKILRQKLGLKQEELANILGVKRSTITKWETGNSKPKFDMIPKLANALNCKIETLFFK